ncbi:MAG: hypothetical protein Unbinned202contig1000_12 [Prokaryotic dsDNA virus sp.]|nr:MAG: hypothetical protein Unbinned202contig1000_12 [Prokaryotic dsDNA virus sp.]|tara:strand:- start:18918 stop:19400 length:483 start_codon:yes stop_codon:yes gene_type:complete
MLKLIPQRKIKKDWEFYKKYIQKALRDTFKDKEKEGLKVIFSKLMNPFNPDMHLWSDNEYLIVTYIHECVFTQRKSLTLYTFTRLNYSKLENINNKEDLKKYKVEMFKLYKDFYDATSNFAKTNNCIEVIALSHLDHIARIFKVLNKDVEICYHITFPIT